MKFDGSKLKERRQLYGFSLEELAKLTCSTKSYIWELESKGKCEPSGMKVFMMSRALGVSMEYFYGEDNSEDIKQAIVNLAHAVSMTIGTDKYYEICQLVYPNFKPEKKS